MSEESFTQVDEATLAAAARLDAATSTPTGPVTGDPVPEHATNDNTVATSSTNVYANSTSPEPRLQVFKEVPGYDPRALVLQYGEKLLDLQFCSCVNKYKKRFAQFLTDNSSFLNDLTVLATDLAEQGYTDLDVKELLEYMRTHAKRRVAVANYMRDFPHDFNLDTLPRAYLARKLMMIEPKLFGKINISPIKCRANCGYPETTETKTTTDVAGF
ncbi:MAG TPA: hypothetical protein VIY48_02755 [Candidatus Paceibacterota bacterium]